jgi:hypothetical protein
MSGYGKPGRSKKEDNFCRVQGCGRKVDAKGLCTGHYRRLRKTGSVQEAKLIRHWGGHWGEEFQPKTAR